jgi:hypothetical protein
MSMSFWMLELIPKLTELCPEPSRLFLTFAESSLTNRRSDFKHNPSFKSCLLRIPGTLNSKNVRANVDAEVKIVQKFQGSVPLIGSALVHDFCLYLADIDLKNKREISKLKNKYHPQNRRHTLNQYDWIERLLVTPIPDCRKFVIDLVLAPYLIVIRNFQEKEAFVKIRYWTTQCNKIEPLLPSSQHFDYRIGDAISRCLQKRIPPISLRKLKQDKLLYARIKYDM